MGWRLPHANTDTNADTNGDGWPNFLADLDPPFYNTLDNYGQVPGVDSQSAGGDRSKRLLTAAPPIPPTPTRTTTAFPTASRTRTATAGSTGDGAHHLRPT